MMIKFENYNLFRARADLKNPKWFRFQVSTLDEPVFFELTGDEFKTYLFLMSEASNKQSEQIMINFEQAMRRLCLKRQVIESTIRKLIMLKICTGPVRDLYGTCTDAEQILSRTEDSVVIKPSTAEKSSERLLDLYALYPKKVGKKRGMAKLRTVVKSEEDFERVKLAIDRYVQHLRKQKTEAKYIKAFDSFINNWEDWDSEESGEAEDFSTVLERTFEPGEESPWTRRNRENE